MKVPNFPLVEKEMKIHGYFSFKKFVADVLAINPFGINKAYAEAYLKAVQG